MGRSTCFRIGVLLTIFFPPGIFAQEKNLTSQVPTTLVYPPFKHAPIHKATAIHLFAYMALIGRADIVPNDPRGISATRLISTDDPLTKNDDDDLTVYGINSGQNNIIFNSSMLSIDVYEGKGPQQKLKKPTGIASASSGEVYVTDTGHNRIVQLHNPGSYLQFVSAHGNEGGRYGEFRLPSGIALSTDGRIYIADTGNDRIQVFDKRMKFMYAIGEKADSSHFSETLFRPEAVAVVDAGEPYGYAKENFLITVDLHRSRISQFTLDGKFIAAVNSGDYGYPEVSLSSVALDFYANVWVTDTRNHCIHKFDKHLNYITTFGHKGEGDNEFVEPRGIAIWKRFGQVFVADKLSAQYYHVGTDILNLEISQKDSSIDFDFFLTEYSKVTARIVDDQGHLVSSLASNLFMPIGKNSFSWNRMRSAAALFILRQSRKTGIKDSVGVQKPDSSGIRPEHCPSGVYRIQIEARTTYIYNRYFTKKTEVEFAF